MRQLVVVTVVSCLPSLLLSAPLTLAGLLYNRLAPKVGFSQG